jgi:hypothetical protein
MLLAPTSCLHHLPGKKEAALGLGADEVVVSSNADEMKKCAGSFDFILDTVSADHGSRGRARERFSGNGDPDRNVSGGADGDHLVCAHSLGLAASWPRMFIPVGYVWNKQHRHI